MTLKSATDMVAGVLRAKRAQHGPAGRARKEGSAVADPTAREFLRRADPILRELIDARADFFDGRLSDESLARMTDEEIQATLTEVPGIGPWTAHGFLIVALDRPDVLLSGDVALRRAVQNAYGFDHMPSEDEMVQVAERWRPYRSLAASYLFASEFEKGT
jgi:3-methyladenine DNA glycosylase/8-oxoguanine DNA glycosylase